MASESFWWQTTIRCQNRTGPINTLRGAKRHLPYACHTIFMQTPCSIIFSFLTSCWSNEPRHFLAPSSYISMQLVSNSIILNHSIDKLQIIYNTQNIFHLLVESWILLGNPVEDILAWNSKIENKGYKTMVLKSGSLKPWSSKSGSPKLGFSKFGCGVV